ncbi:putative methyltransferase-domain-containing protein [Gongronella butleri]|nr:putative methyltransferase-domain-containing protein [Gongronella butleri]
MQEPVKRVCHVDFVGQQGTDKTTILINQVMDAAYANYVWPSSLVLSSYVWHHREQFKGKTALEVGAGTSLTSLVLAKLEGVDAPRVITTDLNSAVSVMKDCFRLNKIAFSTAPAADKRQWLRALPWGDLTAVKTLVDDVRREWGAPIDVILGSDTFYDPADFEKLLVTVSYLIHRHNADCRFITAYQERSAKRSIQFLLDKWSLQCRVLPKDDAWFDEERFTDEYTDDSDQDDENTLPPRVTVHSGSLSSVFLLEISAKNN